MSQILVLYIVKINNKIIIKSKLLPNFLFQKLINWHFIESKILVNLFLVLFSLIIDHFVIVLRATEAEIIIVKSLTINCNLFRAAISSFSPRSLFKATIG